MSSNEDNVSGVDRTAATLRRAASRIRTMPGGTRATTIPEEEVPAPEVPIETSEQSPLPWLRTKPVMPRRASLRETIDDPKTLAGIESLYKKAIPSFSPLQGGGVASNSRAPEILTPIDVEGNVGGMTMGEGERSGDGSMHVSARVPRKSMAVIHTHPYGQKPETSGDDETVANTLQRPNYAISGNAIYVAEPGQKNSRKIADLKYKNGHLTEDWDKNIPIPEPAPTPVYDRGGDVNVNDGRHQLAILEHGERVLTPKDANMYREEHGLPKIKLYDDGGDVDTKPTAVDEVDEKPRLIPQEFHGVPQSDANAEDQLIPETTKGTPAERAAVSKDRKDAMGQGTNGIVKLGLAKIHENHLEPTTYDSTETEVRPRTVGLPTIAAPKEDMRQETAGGPLIPAGETTSEARDLDKMEYKAKLVDYDKRIQSALDKATPEGQEEADRLASAKQELIHKNPWGSANNHPGLLGKIGHIASEIGSRFPVSSEIMAQIPGTPAFRNAQHNSTLARIQMDTPLATSRAAQDNRESASPSWKEVTGGAVDPRHPELGPQQAFYNEKNPSQITFAGAVPPKGSGDKAETREQHLNRYAELKNQQEGGALTPAEQQEFNTLRTELTVPPAVVAEHNKAIDNALRKAGVPQEQWADYHVQPGATSEEDKEATAQARAFAGETYQQGAEGRTIDKEDRAQQRKDQATTVYAEGANGQLIKTTKFDAEKRGLSYEEMKPGDINKDRQALRMLSDVQINTSRYTKAAAKYDAARLTDAQREVDRDNISKMLNSAGLYNLEASISQGGHITVPMITAVGESLSRKERSDEYKKLSPEAKDLFDGYIRTMAAVPAYQKSLTGIGRSNKEMLDLELANIANPTMDPKDILRKQSQFQENIDQAAAGFPNNLPGVKHPSETRRETEKLSGSGESLSVEAPNGTVYNFKTKAEADAFRKKAGL
jgi:hypothetical protein